MVPQVAMIRQPSAGGLVDFVSQRQCDDRLQKNGRDVMSSVHPSPSRAACSQANMKSEACGSSQQTCLESW